VTALSQPNFYAPRRFTRANNIVILFVCGKFLSSLDDYLDHLKTKNRHHDARLIFEVDGGQHDGASPDEMERTDFLHDQDYRILRFWNNDVLSNRDCMHAMIAWELRHHPTLTPHQRGGNALTISEYRNPC
jgi:hypothetical protein